MVTMVNTLQFGLLMIDYQCFFFCFFIHCDIMFIMIGRMMFRSRRCPRSPWPRPARTRASTPSTRRRMMPTQTGTTGTTCCSTVCNFVLLRYNKYATLYAAKQEKKSTAAAAAAPQRQQQQQPQPQPQQQQPGADSKLPDPHAGAVK